MKWGVPEAYISSKDSALPKCLQSTAETSCQLVRQEHTPIHEKNEKIEMTKKNMLHMKEQGKKLQYLTNEEEIGNLHEEELWKW